MPLIGDRRTANALVEWYYSFNDLGEWAEDNDTWELIGSGSFRYAYLHKPSGVVYKIECDVDDEEGYGNVVEAKNAAACRRIAWEHVYIPKTSLFTTKRGPVLAMEYIKGELGSGSAEARRELYNKGRFRDMHGYNFFEVDGKIVPVDMASPRAKRDENAYSWEQADRRVLH